MRKGFSSYDRVVDTFDLVISSSLKVRARYGISLRCTTKVARVISSSTLFQYKVCVQIDTFFTKVTSDNRHRYGTSTAICTHFLLRSINSKFYYRHHDFVRSASVFVNYSVLRIVFFLGYWNNKF